MSLVPPGRVAEEDEETKGRAGEQYEQHLPGAQALALPAADDEADPGPARQSAAGPWVLRQHAADASGANTGDRADAAMRPADSSACLREREADDPRHHARGAGRWRRSRRR